MSQFRVVVEVAGAPARAFDFDCDEVLVGRGRGATLQIAHGAFSRRQFVLRRRIDGKAFDLVPAAGATNPTLGSARLQFGDVVQVGPVRLRLLDGQGVAAIGAHPAGSKAVGSTLQRSTPGGGRFKVIVAIGFLAAIGIWLVPSGAPTRKVAATAGSTIVLSQPPVACPDAAACRVRAQQAYDLAKQREVQGVVRPAELYRAVLDYQRAVGFLEAGGLTADTIADLPARLEVARTQLETNVKDLQFRLGLAKKRNDINGQRRAAALLAETIPDPSHPLRRQMEATKRQLGPKTK